jgi:hypothetical protein
MHLHGEVTAWIATWADLEFGMEPCKRIRVECCRVFSTITRSKYTQTYLNNLKACVIKGAWGSRVLLGTFRSIEESTGHDTREIADLESSHPQIGLRVIDLVQISHSAFVTTRSANSKKLLAFQSDLVLHNSLALETEIVECITFDYSIHRCPAPMRSLNESRFKVVLRALNASSRQCSHPGEVKSSVPVGRIFQSAENHLDS